MTRADPHQEFFGPFAELSRFLSVYQVHRLQQSGWTVYLLVQAYEAEDYAFLYEELELTQSGLRFQFRTLLRNLAEAAADPSY